MNRLAKDGVPGTPGSWQTVVENALDSCISAVALSDLRGGLTYVNRAFLDLWGYEDPVSLGGRPMEQFWDGRDRWAEAMEAVADGQSWVGELMARRKDGSLFLAQASLNMVTDEAGKPLCAMGSFTDITDRKRAERRLAEALDFNRKTLSSSALGILAYRVDTGRCVLANDAAARAVNATTEQMLSQEFRGIASWKDSGLLEAAEAVLASGREQRREFHFVSTFGREVWLDCVLTCFESGGERHLLLMLDDVSERRKAEEALRQSEHKYRELFDNMSNAVAVYEAVDGGADFLIRDFNHSGERMEKVRREEIVGRRLTEVFPGSRDLGFLEVLRRVMATGKAEHLPPALYSDGRIRGWRDNHVYRLPSGQLVAIYEDVTERMEAEEELKRSEGRLRGILSSMVEMVFVLDREGRFAGGFHAGQNAPLLMPPSEFMGRPWSEVLPPELHPQLGEAFSRVCAGRVADVEYWLDLQGTRRWFSAKISPLYVGTEFYGSVAVSREITERKKAEDGLRASEQQYRKLIEQALDGIFVIDGEGRFLLVNSNACRMLGYAEEELLRLNVLDTYVQGKEDEGRGRLARLKAGEALRFERLMRSKDGAIFPVEISAVRLDDGRVQAAIHDITERKRAEEERRSNERFLQSIFDGLQDGLSILDRDLSVVRVNSWMERRYAASGPLIGKKCYEVYHGREVPCEGCPSLKAMRTGRTETAVHATPAILGRSRWVSLSSHPLKDEAGEIVGVIEHVKDITEAKEAEDRQIELARRWQTTFDAIGDAVALLDPEGRILQCNAAMSGRVGMPMTEIVGRTCWEVWFGNPTPVPGCPFEKMRVRRRRETEVFSVNGRWFEMAVDPVLDAGGRLLGAVHIASEITERVKAEAALVQAQKLASVGQLAAGVAHEINNPLSALSGEIQLLSKKTRSKAVLRSLKFMDKVSRRIAVIVAQLLAFSREAKPEAREAVGVNSVVEDALMLMERRLEHGNVRVTKRLGKGLPGPVLNRGQMEQVIINILSNSIDAMPGGGSLSVLSRRGGDGPGGCVEIVIEDSGEGIPKENLAKVFDPFFTTKPPGRGVGLGLSVSHGIVLSHGGRIEVASEPGKGTRVTIALPVPAAEESGHNGGRRR